MSIADTTAAQSGTNAPEPVKSKGNGNQNPNNPLKRFYRWVDKGLLALIITFVLTIPLFTARIYASDEIQYVSYLHSIVFDGDVDFTNEYRHFIARDPSNYVNFERDLLNKKNENGLPINTGPVGSALLWSPFYLLAHGFTVATNAVGLKWFAADGFSAPYEFAITFASLLYGFAGLILSYLLVRNFVPAFYAAFATLVIWLASPVIFYLSLTPPMSHANSLFMISLWLYVWYRTRGWRIEADGRFVLGQRSWRAWFILGLLGGLMTMVREQDGTVLIVAAIESLFCYYKSFQLKGQRLKAKGEGQNSLTSVYHLLARNLLFLVGLGLGFLPQLLVYQALNGHPGPTKIVGDKLQYLSYKVVGQFFGLMFHPDHGMFLWAPVLLLAVIGLLMMFFRPQLRFVALVLLAAYLLELYISAGFQTWTMMGSFGARRLVGISPAFIAGLAYLGWWLLERPKVASKAPRPRRKLLIAAGMLIIIWNFGLIIQFSAIRTTESRKYLDPARVVADQFTKVPGKLVEVTQKFFFKRSDFYKKG